MLGAARQAPLKKEIRYLRRNYLRPDDLLRGLQKHGEDEYYEKMCIHFKYHCIKINPFLIIFFTTKLLFLYIKGIEREDTQISQQNTQQNYFRDFGSELSGRFSLKSCPVSTSAYSELLEETTKAEL